MPKEDVRVSHLLVDGGAEDRVFDRQGGGGDKKIRDVETRAHGRAIQASAESALAAGDERREQLPNALEELRALGVVVVLEGEGATAPLRVDSLDRLTKHRKHPKRPEWMLLSVAAADGQTPERATVWVSDDYRDRFLKLFEEYLTKRTPKGNPRNRELVANIVRIREAVLDDLWRSAGPPPSSGDHWWEIWLLPRDDAPAKLDQFVSMIGARLATRRLVLNERTVMWVRSSWAALNDLPFTDVPVAEIRRPEFTQTILDLPDEDQMELPQSAISILVCAARMS